MRVHELAKLHGVKSKDILDLCKKHKITGKTTASSSLNDDECRILLPFIKAFSSDSKDEKGVTAQKKAPKKTTEVKIKKVEKKKAPQKEPGPEELIKADFDIHERLRELAKSKKSQILPKEETPVEKPAIAEKSTVKEPVKVVPPAVKPKETIEVAKTVTPIRRTEFNPSEGRNFQQTQGQQQRVQRRGNGFVPRTGAQGQHTDRRPQEQSDRFHNRNFGQQDTRRPFTPSDRKFGHGRDFHHPQSNQQGQNGGSIQKRTSFVGDKDFRSFPPKREKHDGRPIHLTEDNLPQIGVMRNDTKSATRTNRRAKHTAGKGKFKPTQIFELRESANPKRRNSDSGPVSTRNLLESAAIGARGQRSGPKRKKRYYDQQRESQQKSMPLSVTVEGAMSVADFAELCQVSPVEVIKHLMLNGQMLTINQTMNIDQMEIVALELGTELSVAVPKTDVDDITPYLKPDDPQHLIRRAPVVTIMGHVDHGKTTLLDRIRTSNIADDEFGGITQHIGAYSVETKKGVLSFLDTPGHEAFTAMRARGAAATDIVILVVSADDGFMPQTIEAISHAQAANVPIVVAVNKIDLPNANPARARQEALQHKLVPEEFGGDTMFIDISAKKNINIDNLLDAVVLNAELLDLKADPEKPAVGVVVESRIDPLRGAVATILVQQGTLKHGDAFVCGDISGNARAMNDDRGRPILSAGPSVPVEIIGLSGSPTAGEAFYVVPNERIAREVAERRAERRRQTNFSMTKKHVTLESLFEQLSEGKVKELNVILKADVQGSTEAILQSIEKIGTEHLRIHVLHSGVGGINESDVNLADASNAIIIGFNVRPDAAAEEEAKRTGVEIKLYRIIYDLTRDLREALTGMLDAKLEEKIVGHARVDQIFKVSKIGTIAGCFVTGGEIARDSKIRLIRDHKVIYEGKLGSLKKFKDDAKKVAHNQECGLTIENYNDIKEGDVIEAYVVQEIKQTLEDIEAQAQEKN